MENPYQPPRADLSPELQGETVVRHLPTWIRFFSWLFLVTGPLIVGTSIFWALRGTDTMTYNLFGVFSRGGLDDPKVLFVLALAALDSIAAYGLLWKKRWGLDAGLLAGGLGLLTIAASFIGDFPGLSSGSNFRLEPFFQIPFIVALLRRRKAWLGQGE